MPDFSFLSKPKKFSPKLFSPSYLQQALWQGGATTAGWCPSSWGRHRPHGPAIASVLPSMPWPPPPVQAIQFISGPRRPLPSRHPSSQGHHPREPAHAINGFVPAPRGPHFPPTPTDRPGRNAGGPDEATIPPGLPAPAPTVPGRPGLSPPFTWLPASPDGLCGDAGASEKGEDCDRGVGRAGSGAEDREEVEEARRPAGELEAAWQASLACRCWSGCLTVGTEGRGSLGREWRLMRAWEGEGRGGRGAAKIFWQYFKYSI